ncbi:MAG: alpha/beta hydrolase [Acidobacteriaceae bacterium]
MNASPHSKTSSGRFRRVFFIVAACLIFVLLLPIFFWSKTRAYLQAMAILDQLNGKPVPRLLQPIAAMPVTTRTLTIPSSAGMVQARLYTPTPAPNAPGLVLVPGIHYLGMDEPRLMAFARTMSACGLQVLTPELPDSRDYRIQPSDVQAIGDSVQWMQNTTGLPVGLMGLNFSGGLALMAAARPPFSNEVSFVFSVGAHDDLLRVATFYATDADPLPDGDVERAKPNNYGPWVLEYEHLEDFVPQADVAAIRPVLRARLYENSALEKQLLANLTATQKAEYEKLLEPKEEAAALFASNKKHAAEMDAVSPHGHLASLHVPVYLLHGRGDTLIPFAEAKWLAEDLPHGTLKELLISPLIAHVTTDTTKPNIWDEWQLLHLLARVMEHAEHP